MMDKATKKSATQLSKLGEAEKLHDLIKPYIEINDSFALYLYSGYSLPSFNESEEEFSKRNITLLTNCLLYTSPSPRDQRGSRMPSSA